MTQVIIPTSTALARYTQTTRLGDRTFRLDFAWNQRESSWWLSLYDAEDEPIALGIKIVPRWPLLTMVQDERRPQGEIVALDTTGQDEPPGLRDLGARVLLVFDDGVDE